MIKNLAGLSQSQNYTGILLFAYLFSGTLLAQQSVSGPTLGAFFQMDLASYQGDAAPGTRLDNSSGSEMRRGQFRLAGSPTKNWHYRASLELFGITGIELSDALISYRAENGLTLTGGHFKMPFGLERMTPLEQPAFMEKSLPSAFVKIRAPGAMVSANGNQWSAAFMLFGDQLYNNSPHEEGGGVSSRITWAPVNSNSHTLHLGISSQLHWPTQQDGVSTYSISSRPESHITSTRLVSTGTLQDVDHRAVYDIELATAIGGTVLQTEYLMTNIDRDNDDTLSFDGWYLQASRVLTGENRIYFPARGIFGAIQPDKPFGQGGPGAWEVAARISRLDLNDGSLEGGRETNMSLGLSWYPIQNVRVYGEWVRVLDIKGGNYHDTEMDAWQMRLQFNL